MKKNGFTLIELLAVILILGVIALIAIPTIANIIKQSKRSAFESTVNNLLSAIETECELQNLEGETLTTLYTFMDGIASPTLELKGKLPTSGTATVNSSCKVAFNVTNGLFTAEKILTEDDITVVEVMKDLTPNYLIYENGTALYFNPVTGLECDLEAYTSNTGASDNGTKTGCMKWYTFNDAGLKSSSVNMILDHNTTALIAWNSTGSNTEGMKEVATALTADTITWKTGLDQRLITANEVATITGHTEWTTGSNWYYFASKTTTQLATCISPTFTGCTHKWLYDRTSMDSALTYGSINNATSTTNGYWTSSVYIGHPTYAWNVNRTGSMRNYTVGNSSIGVRPVITVSKLIF